MLPRTLRCARRIVAGALRPGGVAVDGTAGRGRDALFLARRVGPSGRVFAFDVQASAVEQTRLRLERAGVGGRVELVHAGHESLDEHVDRIDAAMFNLGYLPGSDKRIVTRADSTRTALDAAFERLTPGGAITVVAYRGHPGGLEEADAVERWFVARSCEGHQTARYHFLNRSGTAPILFALIRRAPTHPRTP